MKELVRRLGREPDESRDDADAHTYAWSNETAKAVGRVVYSAPVGKAGKASLSASAMVQD